MQDLSAMAMEDLSTGAIAVPINRMSKNAAFFIERQVQLRGSGLAITYAWHPKEEMEKSVHGRSC